MGVAPLLPHHCCPAACRFCRTTLCPAAARLLPHAAALLPHHCRHTLLHCCPTPLPCCRRAWAAHMQRPFGAAPAGIFYYTSTPAHTHTHTHTAQPPTTLLPQDLGQWFCVNSVKKSQLVAAGFVQT